MPEVRNCLTCRWCPNWPMEHVCQWEPENIPDSVWIERYEIYTDDGVSFFYTDGEEHEQLIGDFVDCPAHQPKEQQ